MKKQRKQPNQPTFIDANDVRRFQPNEVVRYLLDYGGLTMNDLATIAASKEDHAQFAQLIGYSVSGWGDLSYVTDKKRKSVEGNE